MTDDTRQDALIDLETVQAELAPILATMSWSRAQLEDVKAELMRWIEDAMELGTPNPALSERQHDDAEEAVDHAIVAEHERVADELAEGE
jgi:hypothetical protein